MTTCDDCIYTIYSMYPLALSKFNASHGAEASSNELNKIALIILQTFLHDEGHYQGPQYVEHRQ